MYTIEELKQKNLKELKEIGSQLNVQPDGDRRLRRNWIDAIAGATLPLLQLLEASPAVEVEAVQEAIEIQRQEPIGVQAQEPPIESKFGRIVYPRAQKPIAQTEINATISDVESRPASADLYKSRPQTAEPDGGSSSDEAEALGSQKGDPFVTS